MTAFYADFRMALRMLTKSPRFSVAAALTLALGTGPVTAVFSVMYATLFEPMPYRDPDRLVMVWSRTQTGHDRTPRADYVEWKERATSFEYLDVYLPRDVNVALPHGPERLRARLISPGGHRLLGEGVWLGRDLADDEDQPGKDRVLLITHRIWRQRFDSDPSVIGRQVRVDSIPHTVIGVLPPGPQDRRVADVWIPLTRTPDWSTGRYPPVNVVGRLKPGVTLEQAQQEMRAIAADIAQRRPADERLGVRIEPFHNNFIESNLATNLWLLLAAVGFVVLIACVNIAYLLLTRGMARAHELAVRVSLGATAWQLVRLTLTESLLLALCGGALGVLLSVWILQAILAVMPPFMLPTEADPRLSVPVLLFTLAVTIVCALVFGSVAAWQASRLDGSAALRNAAPQPRGRRIRRAIVLAECSLAVTVLGGAGLTIFSFWNRINVDPGLRTERVLTFSLTIPEQQRAAADQPGGFYDQLLDRIQSLPGVERATVTSSLPFTGESMTGFGIVGGRDGGAALQGRADLEVVGRDYFETLGIPLRAGRGFTRQDRAGAVPLAVVSERFATQFLGGRDPLGQRLSLADPAATGPQPDPSVSWQIVGVSGNVTGGQFGDPDPPKIYVPRSQRHDPAASVAVHTTSDPEAVRKSIAAAVDDLSPDLPLARVRTMEQLVRGRLAASRLTVAFFGAMAAVALLLAGLGVYSAMACTVAQQTREIGLRLALGADGSRVVRHVLREGLMLATGGLLLGLAGAYGLGRVMHSALYGVTPLSLPIWTAVAATLLAVAFVASYVPARRASAVDPLVLLRSE